MGEMGAKKRKSEGDKTFLEKKEEKKNNGQFEILQLFFPVFFFLGFNHSTGLICGTALCTLILNTALTTPTCRDCSIGRGDENGKTQLPVILLKAI